MTAVDIAHFMLARINEDETAATRAAACSSPNWEGVNSLLLAARIAPGLGAVAAGGTLPLFDLEVAEATDYLFDPVLEHAGRHDPARVLAECAAKRRIVAEHPDIYADLGGDPDFALPPRCGVCEEDHDAAPWPCPTLLALALPYAGHPDYRQEWAQ